ncbi:uncharacterized protein NECHADRAFT_55114 [Fusarium vanettenii 77-13-4]|uniref:BTB domain-containing protein n=1 Tax=Fusarium vanettenii (strain ATCC MYA-4622 / CBS 123669 / FGSC 9596 / NRRL 45880 / 77-13-4) TaxID=660122 RepID=C7ZMD1_FUSV7|nr:uncharacterized protein NECHADRAFT_55114 [Fusarium vanettenii 77-13-4]EEU34832.1 hypothetical protein NECHADRAFT_55114 [Fusarium vanettenii 77-13-4]
MKRSTYEFSHSNDTLLILHTCRLHSFQWSSDSLWTPYKQEIENDSIKRKGKKSKKSKKRRVHHNEQPSPASCGSNGNENIDMDSTTQTAERTLGESPGIRHGQVCYQMLVSSAHLSQASPVFRKMLNGLFAEAVADSQGLYRITTTGWDPEALVIVLDIMHGHNRSVPRQLTLEMIAKVAMIVDYYDCLEIVEVFAGIWVDALAESQSGTYGKDSMLWLLVSWVFQRQDIFEKMTGLALRHSERLITVGYVPIPHVILRRINEERQNALTQIFSKLYELLDTLCQESECSYECSSMLLGSLMKELSKRDILKPQIKKPFEGYNIASAAQMVDTFASPTWYSQIRHYHSYNLPHTCSISGKMRPTLDRVESKAPVLTLEDFRFSADYGKLAGLQV